MKKRLVVLVGMLAILLAAAVPAFAQDGGAIQGESADGPPPGPPPGTSATLTFELTVEGEPPAGATFFGAIPAEGCISTPLTDPDGDGVFTGSVDVPRFPPGPVPPPDAEPVSLPVQIVQADGGTGPCDPSRVIKDFGLVPIEGDKTFTAGVSFDEGQEPSPETVPVTFELTIDGEVPEGYSFFLNFFPPGAPDARVMDDSFFCTTTPGRIGPDQPLCEEGETYSTTLEVLAGEPFPYDYMVGKDPGTCFDVLSTDTRTFTEAATVSATYTGADDLCSAPVLLGFELTVEGEPPAEATFSGLLRDQDGEDILVLLMDPDGDGVYGGGYGVKPGAFEAQIIQGTGRQSLDEPSRVIKDFGTVTIEEDTTLEASVSFEGGDGGDGGNDGSGNGGSNSGGSGDGGSGSGGSGSEGSGSEGSGSSGSGSGGSGSGGSGSEGSGSGGSGDGGGSGGYSDGATGGIMGLLPNTGGGVALTVLGAGVLLIGGGLLIRRVIR